MQVGLLNMLKFDIFYILYKYKFFKKMEKKYKNHSFLSLIVSFNKLKIIILFEESFFIKDFQ